MRSLSRLRLIRRPLRSAGIVVAATLVLGATSALAANQAKPSPTSDPPAKPSSSASQVAPAKPSGPEDAQGDCVDRVAGSNATLPNKHGKASHGEAVSQGAHECQDGANDSQNNDSQDQEKPDAPEAPDPAESEGPEAGD